MANKSFSAAEGVIAESAKIVDQTRTDLKKQIADLSDTTYQANEQGASDRLSKYTSQLKH